MKITPHPTNQWMRGGNNDFLITLRVKLWLAWQQFPPASSQSLAGSWFVEMKSVIIKSSNGSNELRLSEQEGLSRPEGSEYYRVILKAKDLVVSAKVYAFEPHNELVRYFSDLASHWKGWNGAKKWSSLEGEFSLSCSADGQGHIAMEVILKSGLYEDDWSVQTELNVDAGQLEEIALNTKRFFSI